MKIISLLGLTALLIISSVPAFSQVADSSLQALQDAVADNDAPLVQLLAQDTYTAATAEDRPDVAEYAEYALYAIGVQAEPAMTVELLGTLEELNPESKYLENAYASYFAALNRAGQGSKIPAIAAEALKHQPNNAEVLMALADNAVSRQQMDPALNYASRAATALTGKSAPEGMTAAQWAARRDPMLGRAHMLVGIINSEKGLHARADEALRKALPLLEGNEESKGQTLFYLGITNYQLGTATYDKGRVMDAIQFSEQAGKTATSVAQQALRNAQAMRDYYNTMP
jgi:hypothetical protein